MEEVMMAILGKGRRSFYGHHQQALLTPHDVLDKSFVLRKIGTGYDPDEVDDYLDSVAAAMAGLAPWVTAWDIRQHEFRLTRKRNNFDHGEVDDFLELIALTLEAMEAGIHLYPPTDDPPPPAFWGE
jgi:DivIVA domain-containing protein